MVPAIRRIFFLNWAATSLPWRLMAPRPCAAAVKPCEKSSSMQRTKLRFFMKKRRRDFLYPSARRTRGDPVRTPAFHDAERRQILAANCRKRDADTSRNDQKRDPCSGARKRHGNEVTDASPSVRHAAPGEQLLSHDCPRSGRSAPAFLTFHPVQKRCWSPAPRTPRPARPCPASTARSARPGRWWFFGSAPDRP